MAFYFFFATPMHFISVILLVFSFLNVDLTVFAVAQSIGVCNGRLGDDLPSESEVVEFYKTNDIRRMRIYEPNQATLQALIGSNIELILDVPNEDLQALASSNSIAMEWVQRNIRVFHPQVRFRYISIGNEVDPNSDGSGSGRFAKFVLPAMQNVHAALGVFGLTDIIKVSTATYSALFNNSYPPSNCSLRDDVLPFMEPIISFLENTGGPLLANVYPYFAYVNDKENVPLSYALFTSPGIMEIDGEFGYQNLFDAMVDATYYAVERAGGKNVEIVVSETGWPSSGGNDDDNNNNNNNNVVATVGNAETYYKNLINHVLKGSGSGSGGTKKNNKAIETYLFAMFDENQKSGLQTEKHFGLFSPTKQPKYNIAFN